VGSGALLDIGCNEGRGLEFYQNNGFHVTGLELNSRAADVARKKGFEVHDCELESFQSDKKFDVIVLSNVLEHSLDPVNTLRIVYQLLNANGQVWISCPNSASWLRTLFDKYWINWHVPFHLTHFSPFNLRKMLLDSGFHSVEIKQETPALWVSHSIIARFFAKQGIPTRKLRSAALIMPMIAFIRGLLFPLLCLGNRLGRGDCLVVVAHK
jgi:SAM-dependent methyltransferase